MRQFASLQLDQVGQSKLPDWRLSALRLELTERGEVATALVHPLELHTEVVHEQRFDQSNR